FRRSQGYVVEVADVQDVYDEFNGGVKSARAIRRYLRHAYLTWSPAPSFVVLAGDASMDYRRRLPTSSVDWVPTYLQFEPISGPQGSEQVAHDSHYTLNLSAVLPSDTDFVPSLFLARIPAGNATELDQFVSKVIAYENFQPGDAWRGRMMLVSDDEYSSGIFSAASYCQNPTEVLFHDTNVDFGNAATLSQSGQDLQYDFFDLKTYTDPLAISCVSGSDPNCRNQGCVINAFRTPGGAVDQFHSHLGPGALIVNIEAHANRYLIAHELLYATTPSFLGPDYPKLSNINRPALLMVWGCHANQFPDGPLSSLTDSTDALGEEWLLLADRGSIGSLGSSAFEFLNTNSSYNLNVADAFFTTPPVPTPPPGQAPRARWILGEVLGRAAVENGMSPFTFQSVMNRTINLLGDPMTRMDALPPRIFEVKLNGTVTTDGGSFTNDTPTDSVTVVAKVRDEAGVAQTTMAERDLASGVIAPIDSTTYTTALSDSGRLLTLTTKARPHIGNYDLQVRAIDGNGRLQVFALQIRTPIRYLANGVVIVNNVFVENEAVLRAEITTPIPVTADSLELYLDGVPITVTKTQTDAAGRQWVLEGLREGRGPGSHTLQTAIGGRTAGFDQVSYQVSAQFTMRGVAVVSPQVMGTGCGGSVFQYELSAPASKVELLLFTVAGRRVSSIQMTGNAGFNVYCWDGRDSQNHETAAGVYLYRIKATDATGRTLSQDGRMIRPR
ncbi:MAG: C25 family cysteine peptidase, partial [Candidatus Eiseniibacteriota bacterium]